MPIDNTDQPRATPPSIRQLLEPHRFRRGTDGQLYRDVEGSFVYAWDAAKVGGEAMVLSLIDERSRIRDILVKHLDNVELLTAILADIETT